MGQQECAGGGAARRLPGVVVRERVRSLRRLSAETRGLACEGGGGLRGSRSWAWVWPRAGMEQSVSNRYGLPLLLGQLLALMGHGGAFYLEVRELEEKCFIQEIPDGTVVIGARTGLSGLALPAPRVLRGKGSRAPWNHLRPHLPSPAGGGGWDGGGNGWTAIWPRYPLSCLCGDGGGGRV